MWFASSPRVRAFGCGLQSNFSAGSRSRSRRVVADSCSNSINIESIALMMFLLFIYDRIAGGVNGLLVSSRSAKAFTRLRDLRETSRVQRLTCVVSEMQTDDVEALGTPDLR